MNWISNVVRPKIRSFLKREVPENLWVKCPETGQMVFYKDLEANQFVIPGSNYHMRMSADARLKSLFDGETWFDVAIPEVPVDPLKFRDERRYLDRLKDARAKTGLKDAIKVGFGKLEGLAVVAAVQDFDFMGGSLGMAAGEAVIKALETAAEKGTPVILFASSGGARILEAVDVAALVAEFERIDGHRRHADIDPGLAVEHRLEARLRPHAHVVVRSRDDELVRLHVLVKDELARLRTLDPEIFRHIAAGQEVADLRPHDVGDPVHDTSPNPSSVMPGHSRSKNGVASLAYARASTSQL